MTSPQQQYHDLIFDRVRRAILAFTSELCTETYALALTFNTEQIASGQVLQSAVEFTYNTTTQWNLTRSREYAVAEQAEHARLQAKADMQAGRAPTEPRVYIDPDDVLRPGTTKWSYDYWCHDIRANIPKIERTGFADPLDLAIRDSWCQEIDIAQTGVDWTDRPKYDPKPLALATIAVCSSVTKSLHRSGLLITRFGRALPVFIMELGTDSAGEGDTLAAMLSSNPPGAMADFLRHHEDLREHQLAVRVPQLAKTLRPDGKSPVVQTLPNGLIDDREPTINLDEDLLPDGSNPMQALQAFNPMKDPTLRSLQDFPPYNSNSKR